MQKRKRCESERQLLETLKALSLEYGGAWVFAIKPFSHEVTFYRFDSPAKVPDRFVDLTQNTLAYKGKVRQFSKSALLREQNRGLGRA